jgi:two-component system phosphate regulon sensor histidine kinase PhoR
MGLLAMNDGSAFPTAGIMIALLTFLGLLAAGVGFPISLAVAILWIGSLLLITSKPPAPPPKNRDQPFTSANLEGLIEQVATPLLLTERGTISAANRSARDLLGGHVIGQDPRLVFRQPSAIALIAAGKSGSATTHGLIRRRDSWELNLQNIGTDLALLELISTTAESDVSRAHTDFVANASHELRTPLASILGYAETLNDSADELDTPTAKKFLDTIQREAKRLQSLVSDLMSLSRVEAEKHDQPSEPLDLTKLIERAARDAAGTERKSRLKLDLAKNMMIRGDAQQIEQLVRNLVDNAFNYGFENTKVHISLKQGRNDHARLSVTDEGEGIPAEHIPHLTRRFYRTDPGRSRASGGTGLGLAIVKHIVERHRGRLDIASELGKGTSVIVRIPKYEREAADAS